MKKYLLEIVVFISGAALMVFELAGSRIFAPYLGTSLVVWTSIIGVIMGSLSLGYYGGGKLADKRPQYKVLALVLFSAAIAMSLAAATQYFVLSLLQGTVNDLRLGSFLGAVILFAPASILFGMVSPYAIKLKLNDLSDSGEKIGSMYAVSTVGSIVGTFSGGFILVPLFGTIKILFIVIFAMVATAVYTMIASGESFKKKELILLTLLFSSFIANAVLAQENNRVIVDIDTQYNRVLIFETIDPATQRPIRGYTTDPHGSQSAIFLDQDDDLVFDYLKFYRLSEHFMPDFKKSLMIGGGAFTYPKDYLKRNPDSTLDIVEIDGELESIAKKYFNFSEDERVKVFNEDGRTFLNKNSEKYDCIFMDAYNSKFSIPFQLTTKETVEKLYDSLEVDGVVLANIISSIEGDAGRFLRAEIVTYLTKFSQVLVFPIAYADRGDLTQNILLVALKDEKKPNLDSENPEFSKYLKNYWSKKIELDMPVLEDDYAPVDYYTMTALTD